MGFLPDAVDNVTDGVKSAVGKAASGAQEFAGKAATEVSERLDEVAKPVLNLFDVAEASGDDGGSSNWAAWGHPEIRSMLDTSVNPEHIYQGAAGWSAKGTAAADIVTGLTADLKGIVTGGWQGEFADAANASLGPITDWAARLSEAVDRTGQLMGASGEAAGQAKAAVPPPMSHDWGGTLRSFGSGGPGGAFRDAVAQDNAQAEARAQAVQIMNSVYSAPINENRAAVPAYPALTDPTLQPPETPPDSGRPPGTGGPGPRVAGGGGPAGGGGGPAGGGGGSPPYEPGNGGGGAGSGGGALTGTGGQVTPFQPGAGGPGAGGQGVGGGAAGGGAGGSGAAGGVPVMPPAAMGGEVAGGATQRPAGRFGGTGTGGRAGVAGGRFAGAGAGGRAGFGPGRAGGGSGSGGGRGMAGRVSSVPFGVGGAGARGGMGAGMMGAGAGRGRGAEDTEHERPSYLIEMNDVFNDGRKVAPPVIGEDPPESDR